MARILKKILIVEIRGLSVKNWVFGHFLGNGSLKVSNFLWMLQGNRMLHLTMVPYFGEILIRD